MTTRQQGFSMIELMVAMLVTMIVSGAVFGLMTVGQNTFRREPALSDRQQSIRMAMDLIQRDIAHGGAGMGPWSQVFTRGDGLNEANPFLNGRGWSSWPGPQLTPSGQPSDHLQIIGTIDCPGVPCTQIGNSVNLTTDIGFPACYPEPGMVLITKGTETIWGLAFNAHAGSTAFNFPGGQQPPKSQIKNGNDLTGATMVMPVQLVRYEIAPEADGVPGLWRSSLGGIDPDSGNYVPAPGTAVPRAGWQLVARGIEDMQVRYATGDGAYTIDNLPPRVLVDQYNTLTRDVEVTLWARAIGVNLKGATIPAGSSAGLEAAVRGSAVTVSSPRQVLLTLMTPAAGAYRWR